MNSQSTIYTDKNNKNTGTKHIDDAYLARVIGKPREDHSAWLALGIDPLLQIEDAHLFWGEEADDLDDGALGGGDGDDDDLEDDDLEEDDEDEEEEPGYSPLYASGRGA